MQRWVDTDENDPALFALLECICSISMIVGPLMAPFASVILQRCVLMVETTLKAVVLATSPDTDIDFDFCIVALDLIGALVQGLGSVLCPLLSAARLEPILQRCCVEPRPQIRQAAFALVGDLAEKCSEVLGVEFVLGVLIPAISAHMDPLRDNATHGSANNAVWALGELVQCGRFPQLAPVLAGLVDSLCHLLNYTNVHTSYLENVAVCLGRCLAVVPPPASLGAILPRWAHMIALDMNLDECQSAWLPLVALLHRHPDLLTLEAVSALFKGMYGTRGSPELEAAFHSLAVLMKNRIGNNWSEYCRTTSLDIVNRFNLH
jgi:transportin-1